MPAFVAPSLAELLVPASLLDASETGVMHLRPVYAPGAPARLVDFAILRLNPAAQRLLGLPEFPTGSLLALRPGDTAAFQFYRFAYLAGEIDTHSLSTLPGWRALAQRQGMQLVVSLTPTSQPTAERPSQDAVLRAATDGALARTQQANRQLTQERETLRRVLAQTPAAICLLRGPEYRFEYSNPAFAQLFAGRALEGLPAAQVLPEALNQGFMALLDRVYDTGETFLEAEVPLASPQLGAGGPARYFNFTYQAHLEDGHADRLSVFAYDATEQVAARQQVQRLNEDLQAANEDLRANNAALVGAQLQLQQLNAELEARVAAGVAEARQAQANAEHQRQRLARFFEQAPVAVCVLDGPELVYELVNPLYQRYFLDRQLLGQPVEAVPELVAQHIPALLREVYETGLTHAGNEVRLLLPPAGAGQPPQEFYFNCVYQARYDERGQVDGILVFAYDVTEPVRNRRLAHQLNQELENRVLLSTQHAQATRAAAETQHQQLQLALQAAEQQRDAVNEQVRLLRQILGQLPAAVAALAGPEHRFVFFNDGYQVLSSERVRLGQTVANLFPELVQHGFTTILDEVYTTGQPYWGEGQPAKLAALISGHLAPSPKYIDFLYQPLRNAQGQTQGILAFVVDTTEQVLAQQRTDILQAEAQATAQRQVQEREALYQLVAHTPAAIALLRGPEHRFEYVNPAFAQLFAGQALPGRPAAAALPESMAQSCAALFDRVYQTGETCVAAGLPLLAAPPGAAQHSYLDITCQAYQENGQVVGVSLLAVGVRQQRLSDGG